MKIYKIAIIGLCALAALATVALDNGVDIEKVKKEIRIFEGVIRSSFEPTTRGKDDNLSPTGMNGLYLDGQGVLLSIEMGHGAMGFSYWNGGGLHFSHGDFPEIEPIILDDIEWAPSDMEEQFELAHRAMEDAEFEFDTEGMDGELAGRMRDIAKEKAELMKEMAEIRKKTMAKVRENKDMSEDERQKLEGQAKKVAEKIAASSIQIADRVKKLVEESNQKYAERLAPFINTFLDTVCEYGGNLRSLPANEHLTVVFRNADRSQEEPRDLIYVFTKSDLLACRDGKLSSRDLREKAKHYSY